MNNSDAVQWGPPRIRLGCLVDREVFDRMGGLTVQSRDLCVAELCNDRIRDQFNDYSRCNVEKVVS
jgi:hypothetical protein